MAFDTTWDIEKYRANYESDVHWDLKEKFINAHKTRFAEEQLICLAQVFLNIELMGCRYSAETMTMVAELSKEVAREFRESRKNRLKPTFVTASEAFEAKYKNVEDDDVIIISKKQQVKFAKSLDAIIVREGMPKRPKIESNDDPTRKFYNDYSHLILYQTTVPAKATCVIRESLGNIKVAVKYVQERYGITWIVFNGTRMLCGEKKDDVSEKMLRELQKYFYTIKKKVKFLSRTKTIEKHDGRLAPTMVVSDHAKIDSSNLGFKLLQSLGWNGGGLGGKRKGIEEPIQADIKVNRAGLGNVDSDKLNPKILFNLLTEFKDTNDLCDLVFSPKFTKGERSLISKVAKKCNLKSAYYGKRDCRQIVVSMRITIKELFVKLLNSTDPLNNEKYELIPPTELAHKN